MKCQYSISIKQCQTSKRVNNKYIASILNGELYKNQLKQILPISENKSIHRHNELISEYQSKQIFDPYEILEKSNSEFEINNSKLSIHKYFSKYSNYISSLIKDKKTIENTTYIDSLCNIYLANNLHLRINEEISSKTNMIILKGDYLFSIGYKNIAKLSNKHALKWYISISEMLFKNYFLRLDLEKSEKDKEESENSFISFLSFGCLGLNEIQSEDGMNIEMNKLNEVLLEMILNYVVLVYIKDELYKLRLTPILEERKISVNIKNGFFSHITNQLGSSQIEERLKMMNTLFFNPNENNEIYYFSVNLCFEIISKIDNITNFYKENMNYNKEMTIFKDYVIEILNEIEYMNKELSSL